MQTQSESTSGLGKGCGCGIAALVVVPILLALNFFMHVGVDAKPEWMDEESHLLRCVRDGIEKYYRVNGRLPAGDSLDEVVQALRSEATPSVGYLASTAGTAATPLRSHNGKPFFYTHDEGGRGYLLGWAEESHEMSTHGHATLSMCTDGFRLSPDGARVAVLFNPDGAFHRNPLNGSKATVVIADAITGEAVSHLQPTGHRIFNYGFLEDGRRLVTTDTASPVSVWDAGTGALIDRPIGAWEHSGFGVDYVHGTYSVMWREGVDVPAREQALRDLASRGLMALPFPATGSGPDYFAVDDGNRWMACVGLRENSLWNARTGERIRYARDVGATAAAFAPGGGWYILALADSHIAAAEIASGVRLRSFDAGKVSVRSMAFTPDGGLLAVGCSALARGGNYGMSLRRGSGRVLVFDANTAELRRTIEVPGRDLPHVRFTPDGKMLVAEDGLVRLGFWDTATWEKVRSVMPWPKGR